MVQGFLVGFVEGAREFLGLIFASIRSFPSLEFRSTPGFKYTFFDHADCFFFFFFFLGGGGGILWVCEDLTSV